MNIAKIQQPDGKRVLFRFFRPNSYVLPILFFITIFLSEALYRFKLHAELGLENCIGPAGLASIAFMIMLGAKARNDTVSHQLKLKKQGLTAIQRVMINERGVELHQGSLMTVFYIWPSFENITFKGKNIDFSLPGGVAFLIKKSYFSQEEIDQISVFLGKKGWPNKTNALDQKPAVSGK